MALVFNENNAVSFVKTGQVPFNDLTEPCDCVTFDFCQPINRTDIVSFQVCLSPFDNTELVTNGDFSVGTSWTLGANWGIGGGTAGHGVGLSGSISQEILLRQFRYYRIKFDIVAHSGGGVDLTLKLAGNTINTFTTTGSFTEFVFITGNVFDSTILFDAPSLLSVVIDNVSVIEYSFPAFSLQDLDGNVIFDDFTGTFFTFFEEKATIILPFDTTTPETLPPGCFQICISDRANMTDLIGNGDFISPLATGTATATTAFKLIDAGASFLSNNLFQTYTVLNTTDTTQAEISTIDSDTQLTLDADIFVSGEDYNIPGWSFGANWSISGSTLIKTPGMNTQARTVVGVKTDTLYILSFDVSAISGTFDINIAGNNVTTITTTGKFSGAFTLPSIFITVPPSAPELEIDPFAAGNTITIENIELLEITLEDACSECFNIAEEHDCTFNLSWTNDENAFGFDYENFSLTHQLRIKGKFVEPRWTKDKEPFEDSLGNNFMLFSHVREIRRLVISGDNGGIPEYLHRPIAKALEHDDFFVNEVRFINEEDTYEPDWRRSSLLASIEIELIRDGIKDENNSI